MNINEHVRPPFLQGIEYNNNLQRLYDIIEKRDVYIIWLASYPRSGNRLLSTLLYFAVNPDRQIFDYPKKIIGDIHHTWNILDNIKIIPEYAFRGKKVIFLKSHFPFNGMTYLANRTIGAVHIYRHPFDVAVSDFILSEYYSVCHDIKMLDAYLKNYFVYFTNFYLSPTASFFGYSSWPEHYFSWKKLSQYSNAYVYSISYETMMNNMHNSVSDLLTSFEIGVNDEIVRHICDFSKRSNLAKLQESGDIERLGESFLGRNGKITQHLTHEHIKLEIQARACSYKSHLDDCYRRLTKII
jgi:hypothetical protein